MSVYTGNWATQQLAEFVAAVSTVPDEDQALRSGVERVAEALDADAVALVRGGTLKYSIGWPVGAAPAPDLCAAAIAPTGFQLTVPVPGLGQLTATTVEVGEGSESALVVARAGEPLDVEERGLLRAMARALALALDNHEVLGALRERQRLLEGLSGIQHAIAHRAPIQHVLDAVVTLAREMLDEDQAALILRDQEDPERLRLAASIGVSEDVVSKVNHHRIDEGGVCSRAMAQDSFVLAEDYSDESVAMPSLTDAGLTVAMAAPVHEANAVVGSLVVSSYVPGRRYSTTDQAMLVTLAEHATLALTDARTVSDMMHQALHDTLTGLPNRALLGDRLTQALQRTSRTDTEVGVLFVDLDRFKPINDSLGHAAGDELLRVVAQRISGCLRKGDTAARLGGDEFAVLLERLGSPADAVELAQRIIGVLKEPVKLDGRSVLIGASVGIATGRRVDPYDLLRHADVAMYRAKAAGKGRSVLYEPQMQDEVVDRLELESDLRHALERDELELFYQPVMELTSGRLTGVEALLRWRHPQRGLLAPAAFITIAEETGLIVDIGGWALSRACQQLAEWRRAGASTKLTMGINLAGRQLQDPGLHDAVAAAMASTRIEPGSLVLEVDETVLMRGMDVATKQLESLRSLGIQVALDDFGSGFSSLRYLDRLPVDQLKMARPFIEHLDAGAERRALTQAMLSLGASLGLRVIALGIERTQQLEVLLALGCAYGQGFHFGVPAAAAEIEPLILNQGVQELTRTA